MAFLGCTDFKVDEAYNYVSGSQNVNHTTNNLRDSNNRYQTDNHGDGCVTNNGGRVTINQEQRPLGKKKWRGHSDAQGVGHGYEEPIPIQSSDTPLPQQQPFLSQIPPQPRTFPPSLEGVRWISPVESELGVYGWKC